MDAFFSVISDYTHFPNGVMGIMYSYWRGVYAVYSNAYAFAFVLSDGSVATTGLAQCGGDHKNVAYQIQQHGTDKIYTCECAFFAKLLNGHVLHWGSYLSFDPKYFTNLDTIATTQYGIAIKTQDSKVHTFGKLYASENKVDVSNIRNVRRVTSTSEAFAVSFHNPYQGAKAWGHPKFGGYIPPQIQRSLQKHGVKYIVANDDAFAACLHDESGIEVWGRPRYGGVLTLEQRLHLRHNKIASIHSTGSAFAAKFCDGSVFAWGNPLFGGDMTPVKSELDGYSIEHITASNYAFTAIAKGRRSIISWGAVNMFGLSIHVPEHVTHQVELHGVTQIISTSSAFLALLGNRTIVAWGDVVSGGDTSSVIADLKHGVDEVYSNYGAFAVKLCNKNGLVVWGNKDCGGYIDPVLRAEINAIGVTSVYSTMCAFAVTLLDGSVRTWGSTIYGGDSTKIQDMLVKGHHH